MKEWLKMNKFLIALLVTIFGFSFSNKAFAKSVIVEKKKNNIVDVVFILDRSGSMGGLESDTIGGFNSMLEKQRKIEGKAFITTVLFDDQYEYASKEYNSSTVKKLIETQKEKYGWEFLFLGANIDAIETANTIGISAERAVNYKSDSIGTKKNYDTLNKAVEEVRSGKDLDKNWKADIEADYNERNKK